MALGRCLFGALVVLALAGPAARADPLALAPGNPHLFQWRGRAVVLVASGEHYGSLINRRFAFDRYLDTIAAAGLNHTRVFLGDYVERRSSFGVVNNPLEPAAADLVVPWARSATAGFSRGGNKFDLNRWDARYFERLHAFFRKADALGITAEAVLFFVGPGWADSPFHASNNVNALPVLDAPRVLTLDNGPLLARQEAYVRKLVRELNRYDGVLYNVCNEPWFVNGDGFGFVSQPAATTKAWIRRVSDWIRDEESRLPKRHLISVDTSNRGTVIAASDVTGAFANIDVHNFHYDRRALSVLYNRSLPRPLAFNETGLEGTGEQPYVVEGWNYLLTGGALFGNLDYSFWPGREDGTGTPAFDQSWYDAGGGPNLRARLAILLRFMNALPLADMRPDDSLVVDGEGRAAPDHAALASPRRAYAVWFPGDGPVAPLLALPAGRWRSEWIDTTTGATADAETFVHKGGVKAIRAHARSGGGSALRVLRAD